jgi:hypothetical protein
MLFSLPIHMSHSPLEATLHSFQYKKRLHAAAGSTVEGKNQLHILSVVSGAQIFIES